MNPGSRPQPAPQDARRESFAWRAAAIFLVALVVRLTHVWQIRRAPFFTVLMGDARAYDDWAQQIAHGDWIGHEVFYQAPLYPYFLGFIYTIAGHNLLTVRVCQAIIGSVSCALLGFAAHRLFSRPVGLIAGLCLALYAPAIFFDGLLQKSVLDVFFICLMLWLLSGLMNQQTHREGRKGHKEKSSWSFWSSWFGLGLSAGGLSLTRENALVFIAVVLLWTITRVGLPRRERITAAGLFLAGLALVLAPVAVRNGIIGGEFFVTTSQFGPNFYIGNHARSDGTYMSLRYGRGAPEYERQDARELAEQATGRQLTPAEVSSYWTGRAFDFITSQPAAWLKLVARKFALVWNRTEMLDTESQEAYAEWSLPVRVAGHVGHFGVLVPLAFLGVCLTWPQRQKLWVLYAMLATYAASVVMFYVFARYRYPLVPFLILFGSVALAAAPGYVASAFLRKNTVWPGILAATAVVAVLANWPILSTDLMQAITETNLAAALQSEGKLDEATDHYRRAMALKADYAPAYNNLGVALRAKGQVDAAVATYQRAIALEPNYPDAHFNLANALLAEGKVDEAIDHFRLALKSSPGGVDVHNNLGIALATKGQLDEAVAEFRVALQLDPDSAWTHRNLGDSLASQGHTDEAADHLQRAVRLDPQDGQAHYDLASLLLESHKFAEATDEFRTAVRLMPDSAEALNNLGVALGSSGRLDEAIDQFRQALQRKPDFIDAERNLAMALEARRQMPRARGSR